MATMTDQSRPGAAGDGRAAPPTRFDAVVVPHLDVLFRVARSLSVNSHDAEDLVQDTLLRAFRALDSFDGRHPRAWLLTIMRNTNINRHRRQRPTLLRGDSTLSVEVERRNPPAPSAEDQAAISMTAPWLTVALDTLSPRLREVVQLVDVEAVTYDEAAASLGIPVGTVMSRLHRARRRIRTHLTNHPNLRSEHA